MGQPHQQEALQEYNEASAVAKKTASLRGSEAADLNLIDAQMKIGDIYRIDRRYAEAQAAYQSGLGISDAALTTRPDNLNLLRAKGKALVRLADLKQAENASDDARDVYRKAVEVQDALISRDPRDLTLKSNLAATYTRLGMLEKRAGDLDLALTRFQQGAALNEELIKADPGNPQWRDYIVPSYLQIAEILDQLNRPKEALVFYQRFYEAKRTLAFPREGPARAQKEFADAGKLLGDHSAGLSQIDAYRGAVRIGSKLVDDPKAVEWMANQFDIILGIARVFDAKKDWPDAQAAYRIAQKIAILNFVKNPSDTAWRDKAEAAERASVEAGKAADTPH